MHFTLVQFNNDCVWNGYMLCLYESSDIEKLLHSITLQCASRCEPTDLLALSSRTDIIAMIIGAFDSETKDAQLSDIWVSPDLRSQKIGSYMLQWFERMGRAQGCTFASLIVTSRERVKAEAFYRKNGYTQAEHDTVSGFYMIKSLEN